MPLPLLKCQFITSTRCIECSWCFVCRPEWLLFWFIAGKRWRTKRWQHAERYHSNNLKLLAPKESHQCNQLLPSSHGHHLSLNVSLVRRHGHCCFRKDPNEFLIFSQMLQSFKEPRAIQKMQGLSLCIKQKNASVVYVHIWSWSLVEKRAIQKCRGRLDA